MPEENIPQPPPIRPPSNSTLVAAFGGGGTAATVVWIAREFFALDIPAEVAVWLGSVLGGLLSYPFEGGRK
jgi:hypothetical protein